ncbi:hypothetical protein EKTHUN627_44940 [Enterobacter kobei]|nr:hypothetical protein EKTHUN627_44940 [Enterobacter kobei]
MVLTSVRKEKKSTFIVRERNVVFMVNAFTFVSATLAADRAAPGAALRGSVISGD